MTETFTERTAGIWVSLVFYVLGGVYMLAVWGVFARAAYYLAVMGVVSILISASLYLLSRWGFVLGLFTFPLFFLEFLYALNTNVSFLGWDPTPTIAVLNASFIAYLVFSVIALILLIDRRNTLKGDRVLDLLRGQVQAAEKPGKTEKASKSA
jgi:hypothetical protein